MGGLMKVIIPLARVENRHKQAAEYTPLIEIAGKSLLGHLIDQVMPLKPEEIIFIVSAHENVLIKYVKDNCKIPFRFIKQKSVKGSAHAIYGAKKFVSDDLFILFGDTLFNKEALKSVSKTKDGVIWVSEVIDPREFGVVFMDGQHASRLIEKPDEPVSNQVMIGLYYFKQSVKLFDAIKYLLDNNIKTKDEYHLTDAIQVMINNGAKIATAKVKKWVDVDREGGLLLANRYLCEQSAKKKGKLLNTVIIPPVSVEKGAIVTDSVIGPNVSIASDCKVSKSILNNTIISKEAIVKEATLTDSIVGHRATVKGHFHKVHVADRSQARID